MKIGILGAMQEEVAYLARQIKNAASQEIGMRVYTSGKIGDLEAVLVFSRWGKVASASTVTTLIDRFDADFVLFAGLAGAAAPELEIGDVVVASELMQHDVDASALPMFQKYEIPLLGQKFFKVKPSDVQMARECAEEFFAKDFSKIISAGLRKEFSLQKPKVVTGLIASGDQFIADPAKMKKLRGELPQLACVEMEGGAVAQVCYEHKVPFSVVRIISDKADHSATVDFPKFVSKAASLMSGGIAVKILQRLSHLR